MLELRLVQGSLLRKVVEAIKDLVNDANFDCSPTGFSLQAMDSSHVALVALLLRSDGFDHYRCDRNISMGMNLAHVSRMLRCAGREDVLTIKADDGGDAVNFMFESPNQDKIADFEMKLMDIDSEHLGIPETDYDAIVRMPAAEFARICKDLTTIGDIVVICVSKEGVKFSARGDFATAKVICRQNTSVDQPEEVTIIEMEKPVSLLFALRYMNSFTKATPLATQVTISLSADLPLVIEDQVAEMGHIRYYLAPKIEEDEGMGPQESKSEMAVKPGVDNKPKVESKLQGEGERLVKNKLEEDIEAPVEIINLESKPQEGTQAETEAMDVGSKPQAKAKAMDFE